MLCRALTDAPQIKDIEAEVKYSVKAPDRYILKLSKDG